MINGKRADVVAVACQDIAGTELDELMCRPDVLTDRNQLSKLTKERSDLEPLVGAYGRYR